MMEDCLETIRDIVRDLAKVTLSTKQEASTLTRERGKSQTKRDLKNQNSQLRKALKDVRTLINETLQDGDSDTEEDTESSSNFNSSLCETDAPQNFAIPSYAQKATDFSEYFISVNKPAHHEYSNEETDVEIDKDDVEMQEVIAQSIRDYFDKNNEELKCWTEAAVKETENVKQLKHMPGRAVILCLDISESMNEGNAWERAKEFLLQYFNGIEALWEQGSRYDFIGIVAFGEDVSVKVNPTQDLDELRNAVETLTLGGLTPMFGGLVLARSLACTPEKKIRVNDYLLKPQIILVTDGRPTELGRTDGNDAPDEGHIGTTKTSILYELQFFQDLDFHCVPVGDCVDKDFLTSVLKSGRANPRKLMTYKDGLKMAMFSTNEIAKYGNKKYVNAAARDIESRTIVMTGETVLDMYKECRTVSFKEYPIGMRVRRGNDWRHKNDDSHGVGTIIGHDEEHSYGKYVRVWVEWDNGRQCSYVNTVLSITHEDRIPPKKEIIAVGSTVRPGKDFKKQTTESDVDETNHSGVVIRFKQYTQQAKVKWENESEGWYHFGQHGTLQEIAPVRIPEPPFDFSDRTLSELDLQMVADKIGKNWRVLGVELGLTDVMLDQIAEDATTSVHRIATMLKRWKDATGEQATLQNLLTVMRRKASVVNIAWDEIEEILFQGKVPQWYKKMKYKCAY